MEQLIKIERISNGRFVASAFDVASESFISIYDAFENLVLKLYKKRTALTSLEYDELTEQARKLRAELVAFLGTP